MDALSAQVEALTIEFRQETSALRQETSALRQETSALRQEMSALRREFRRELRQEIGSVNLRIDETATGLRVLIESVQDDVKLILEHLVPAMRRLDDHETRITRLERGRRKPS